MRVVPRSYLEGYDNALAEIRERASAELKASLGMIDYSADPTAVREGVLAVMQAICGGASEVSAMESAIFYDGLRERVVGSPMGAKAQDGRSAIGTDKAVRAFLTKLFDGDEDAFEELCQERLDYEITAAAGRCMQYNAQSDPDMPRYARIPQGETTCDFCIMLASRGPVYHTAESAGALTKFHAHCDCKIMPFWGTYAVKTKNGGIIRRSGRTSYEGYDPDAYFQQYVSMMLNPNFGDAMARAADRAKTKGASGRPNKQTRDFVLAQALKDGYAQFPSLYEVNQYIAGAETYEDLMERIKNVNKEIRFHFPSEAEFKVMQGYCNSTRERLLKNS